MRQCGSKNIMSTVRLNGCPDIACKALQINLANAYLNRIKRQRKIDPLAVAAAAVERVRAAVVDDRKIAGIVLAGGRSSRMGRNKALLEYNGAPLLDHMIEMLEQVGLNDVYVSGAFEGYSCIPDSAPHAGPAHAMCDVLTALNGYDGVLFVPVDMPLIKPEMLELLSQQIGGAYFAGFPFPAFIKGGQSKTGESSVKALLEALSVLSIPLPLEFETCMNNTNTPEEWTEALRA